VMTIVLDTLAKITKSRGKLPPTLYLHLDNCWRENKNKYVCSLVDWNIRPVIPELQDVTITSCNSRITGRNSYVL
jgi:hypothetical protein